MTEDDAIKLMDSDEELTRSQAAEILGHLDHCFLDAETARRLSKPFGFSARLIRTRDRRSEFKGLYVPSVNEGDEVVGIGAEGLAEQICQELHIGYHSFFGRGSQLRECVDRIEKQLAI